MDKKENKRLLKMSPYFQYRPKKGKKSLLFSAMSMSSSKISQDDVMKKSTGGSQHHLRSNRIYYDVSSYQKENNDKISTAKTLSTQRHQHSTFKYIKDQNKIKKQLLRNNENWRKEPNAKWIRQSCTQSPHHYLGSETKPSENLVQSRSIDSEVYEKQIKRLEGSVNRYRKLHINSLKKIRKVKEKAKEEEMKYQRAKQIYAQKIRTLDRNLKSNKNVLGHLFSYQEINKGFIPNDMILEVSGEDRSRDLREIQNELQTFEQYYKSTEASMVSLVSNISINSKSGTE